MEGYGLYWYCLEMIAGLIDRNHLTFELEHDAELIAHDTGIHYELVQEMMTYMVNQGLFENSSGTITCIKMAKRIDQSMTSDTEFRRLIKELNNNHDKVMTESCLNQDLSCKKIDDRSQMLDDIHIGDISSEKSPRLQIPFQKIVNKYHEILPELPKCEILNKTRQGYIRQRWLDKDHGLNSLEEWENFFKYIRQSNFLMGKVNGSGDKPPFRANLEWVTKPTNYTKIYEGKYHG